MLRAALILVLCVLLVMGSSGCVAFDVELHAAMGENLRPMPGSNFVAFHGKLYFTYDILLTLCGGIGLPALIFDIIYLWVWGGGYAERYYRDHPDERPKLRPAEQQPAREPSTRATPPPKPEMEVPEYLKPKRTGKR